MNAYSAANSLWRVDRNCHAVDCARGTILIEGAVFRVENQVGRRALDHLAALIDREGPASIARAEGDFVAIIATDQDTFAFKSFTSQYQIYYRESDGKVANRLGFFFDASNASWNQHYFARHVLLVPGYQFLSTETPLDNVSRVLPGELIRLRPSVTRQQLIRRNYTYRLDVAQRNEDVAPDILAILRNSIKSRLAAYPDAKLCVEISGGLDSSFIACLLGEEASNIRGVMFSQPNVPSHVISEGYAREVADRYGIDLVVMRPEDLPDAVDENPDYADEPSDFFWFGDLFSRSVANVAEPGSQIFTGFGADQLFLRSPSFLPYLLQRREYRHFAKALPPASALLSRGRANLGWQCMLSLVPEGIHRRLNRAFADRGWNPWDVGDVNMRRMLTDVVPWLRCGRSLHAYSGEREKLEKELVGDGIICDDWGYFSAPRTVTQSHFAAKGHTDASPYCDLPLLDFVYDEVSALRVHDFEGRYKELLRECQKGIVPESLRGRQNDTFVFNSFQLTYVNKARAHFASLLKTIPDGWIDQRGANHALEQLSFGITTSSTRSALALMGYLSWRRAFIEHCTSPGGPKIAGAISARSLQS
ncbi:MAG: asparagine synthase-related protein [Bradyrhizobium sp.]|nr:asparagine synthase-related protein [Bradyrhizobium sp.]